MIIQVTHINAALVLYGVLGVVFGVVLIAHCLREMPSEDWHPVGILLGIAVCALLWPIVYATVLYEMLRGGR
jgi:hypothetical protein